MLEIAVLKRAPNGIEARFKRIAHFVKFFGHRPLERVNRLLFIADDEHGFFRIRIHPQPRGQFTGQRLDHIPLGGAGVLGFVDQDVVKRAIQPIKHPVAHIIACQKIAGFQDQIVKIQEATLGLVGLIGA